MIKANARAVLARAIVKIEVQIDGPTFRVRLTDSEGTAVTTYVAQVVPDAVRLGRGILRFPLCRLPAVLALLAPVPPKAKPRVYRSRRPLARPIAVPPVVNPDWLAGLVSLGFGSAEARRRLAGIPSDTSDEQALLLALAKE